MSFVEIQNAWKKIGDGDDVVVGDQNVTLINSKQSTYCKEFDYDHWHGSRQFPTNGFVARCVEVPFKITNGATVLALTFGDLEPEKVNHLPYTIAQFFPSADVFETEWKEISEKIDTESTIDREWTLVEYKIVDNKFIMQGTTANPKTSKQLKSTPF